MTSAPLLDDDGFVVEETGVRQSHHPPQEDPDAHPEEAPNPLSNLRSPGAPSRP